jgi:hypothetical protein
MRTWLGWLAAIAVGLAALPAGAGEATVRRFALVVGANNGGPGRARLQYAGTDAAAMAKVLVELGGVAPVDRVLLLDPDRQTLESTLATLGRQLAAARARAGRIELVFYYSGHSDEEGLLLRGERLRYPDLRRQLEAAAADVRIAILDSCASGALTRDKGGVRRAPFLVDASAQVKGHAFLTSASAHEAAQESDRLHASFFTHALLTGLRGAADLGHDGRVTLNEAYHFAFQETLARTERTLRGAQHPNFDIQLVGTGDLVMTDLRGTSAGLKLHEDVAGRVFVRDDEGVLVAELAKPAGRSVELGLDPGGYRVTVDRGGQLAEAHLTLVDGWRTELAPSALAPVLGEATASRGDVGEPGDDATGALAAGADGVDGGIATGTPPGYRRVPLNLTLFPGLALGDALAGGSGGPDDRLIQEFALNFTIGRSARLDGAEVSLIASFVDEDARGVEIAGGGSVVEGRMHGVQAAVAGNLAGTLDGMQLAFGANASRGGGRWLQIATGFNWVTEEFRGAQLATGLNWAGELDGGIQVASGANIVRRRADGLQIATAANIAPEVSGLQAAAAFNYASRLEGAQLAVVNVGGDVSGLQLGLVNVAAGRVDTQVGLVNVADDAEVPIGLVSLSRTGLHHLDVWANETTPLNVAVRLGGRRVYGIFTGGGRSGDGARFVAGGGLGYHLPLGEALFADADAIAQYVMDPDGELDGRGGGHTLQTLRLAVGYDLGPVAVLGGPTYNVLGTYGRDPAEQVGLDEILPGTPLGATEWEAGTARFRGWPGFFVGTQL